MSNKLLVVIGGPTGVGKTNVTIDLAQHYQTEIINADSRQVYTELNIGVGRPSPKQLASVPHHLIGKVSILDHYSVGHYAKDALAIIEQLFQNHDILFLSGGSGLYVKAIMEGVDDIPDIPHVVNERWTKYWKENGTEALAGVLEKMDPEYYRMVDLSNPIRLIRAISVSEFTGEPFSSFRKGQSLNHSFKIFPIVLELSRSALYQRIDQRAIEMMDNGWLEEAKTLYPYRQLKALQTVGYKELFEFLDGMRTLPETISAIQQSTRRYAKRQMTWWRNQGKWVSFSPDDIDAIIKAVDHERTA